MKIKKTKIPPQFSNNRLLWSFDYNKEQKDGSINFVEIKIDILDDFQSSDFLSCIPDPLINVLGVTIEPMDLLNMDRSTSPRTSRAHHRTHRGRQNQPNNGSKTTRSSRNQMRELSLENKILREMKTMRNKTSNKNPGEKIKHYKGRAKGKNLQKSL